MKSKDFEKNGVQSLNAVLPEFFIEDLEQRLETDPLATTGLLNMDAPSDGCLVNLDCERDGSCSEDSVCILEW